MLESLEGKRGVVRAKPPLPGDRGALRPPDDRQQRADARHGPADHRRRPGRLPGARRRALARHPGVPARGQRRARRHRGAPVRRDDRASSSTIAAAGHGPGVRCAPCRSAARSARTSRGPASTSRWTTRSSPRRMASSGTAASSCSTTPSISPARPGSRWSSARRSRAASARRAGSGPCEASSSWTACIAGEDVRREPRAARRSLRGDDRRIVVRHGRADAASGAQRAPALRR